MKQTVRHNYEVIRKSISLMLVIRKKSERSHSYSVEMGHQPLYINY